MKNTIKKLGSILMLVGTFVFAQTALADASVTIEVGKTGTATVTSDSTQRRTVSNIIIGDRDIVASVTGVSTGDSISQAGTQINITAGDKVGTTTIQYQRSPLLGSDTTFCTITVTVIEPSLKFADQGVNFTTLGATTNYVGGELVLTFIRNGSMEIDKTVKNAQILVVGGGGSGSSGGTGTTTRQGHGGTGGGVVYQSKVALAGDTYSALVGGGGAGLSTATSGSSRRAGNAGTKSSFSGGSLVDPIEGAAGTAGGNSAVSGAGTVCAITGQDVTYGKDGDSSPSQSQQSTGAAGDPNTGNGGGGAAYRGASGAGGSGVVIVRIPRQTPEDPTVYAIDMKVGARLRPEQVVGTVAEVVSDNEAVATVDAEGCITAVNTGTAQVTIEDETFVRHFNVTVKQTANGHLGMDYDMAKTKTLAFTSGTEVKWTVAELSAADAEVISLDKTGTSATATKDFSLTVTAKKKGSATVVVSNDYAICTYSVTVTAEDGANRESTVGVKADSSGTLTITCPGVCSDVEGYWKVLSDQESYTNIVGVTVDGTATRRPSLTVMGKKAGEVTIILGTDADKSHTWTVNIVVQERKDPIEMRLDTKDDASRRAVVTCTSGDWAGNWTVRTTKDSVAYATIVSGGASKACEVEIVGVCAGEATITVENEFVAYTYKVTVTGEYRPSLAQTATFTHIGESGTVTAKIGYEGATTNWVQSADGKNWDLVLTFTNKNAMGRFELPDPKIFRVRALAVGGGAGGTQAKSGHGAGGGGAGGYCENSNLVVQSGLYYVSVGSGGTNASERLTAAPGMNGGVSIVTNVAGRVLASAIGGGGGGTSIMAAVGGQSGGSGGGGSWVNDQMTPGVGGSGRDGQGHDGGTPANEVSNRNNGAGGGGAGSAGGAHGEAGEGILCDIAGGDPLEYARGGLGGTSERDKPAAAGRDGFGWGGEGGSGSFGGKGGDGAVIVRFSSVFENVKVPYPTVLNGGLNSECFEKTETAMSEFELNPTNHTAGTKYTFVSFNPKAEVTGSDGEKVSYEAIMSYVSGVSMTNAWYEKIGATNRFYNTGHYQYSIHLKDGYSWDDGSSYGSTDGYLVEWRITPDLRAIDPTISVRKNVVWGEDGSNAMIRIVAHATPAMSPITPKVLFIGTVCGAHSMKRDTVPASINKIAEKGTVDYYIYKQDPSSGNPTAAASDRLVHGSTLTSAQMNAITGAFSEHNQHQALKSFLYAAANYIDEAHTNYDYIVMEFDGSRISANYTSKYSFEEQAASRLRWYYENDRVIWAADKTNCDGTGGKAKEIFSNKIDGEDTEYYRPNTFFGSNGDTSGNDMLYHYPGETVDLTETGTIQYYGLCALLDPVAYENAKLKAATEGRSATVADLAVTNVVTDYDYVRDTNLTRYNGAQNGHKTNVTFYANTRNALQTNYEDVDRFLKLLADTIVPTAYNLKFSDQVKTGVGLSLTSIRLCCATNNAPENAEEGWMEFVTWNAKYPAVYDYEGSRKWSAIIPKIGTVNIEFTMVEPDNNRVTVTMSDMRLETWARLDIGVVDDGTFKTSADGAVYDAATGMWEKDPNDGKASVIMVDENGQSLGVEGEAETNTRWCFSAYQVTTDVENGEIFLNGLPYDSLCLDVGYSPVISYRGNPGFRLARLDVDGSQLFTFDTTNMTYWVFPKLASDHKIKATYESYVDKNESAPTTNAYDACGHVISVDYRQIESVDYDYEIRYALPEDKDDASKYVAAEAFTNDNRLALKVIGSHEIHYLVFVCQPSWGKTIDEPEYIPVCGGVNTNWVEQVTLYAQAASAEVGTDATDWKNSLIPPGTTAFVTFSGFVGGEDESVLVYDPDECVTCPGFVPGGLLVRQYPTVVDVSKIQTKNYKIVGIPGAVNVGKSPFVIGGKRQTGEEDPDDPAHKPTGVEPVVKTYDGVATSIVVHVDWPTDFPSGEATSFIKYAYGFVPGEPIPDEAWQDTLPVFSNVTASTGVRVWYRLEDDRCFAVTNYSYVTILPREITVKSRDASKEYDGSDLTCGEWDIVAGKLADGDEISVWCKSYLATVGSIANNFDVTFLKGDEKNYVVTKIPGTLTVT